MEKNYVFKPWIPEGFGNSDLGRLFIVGDSHYIKHDEKDLPNFTRDIISELGEYSPAKFLRKLGETFNPENYKDIYSKASFANAIQVGMKEADDIPSQDDYKTVEPAIRLYLDEIKPTRMVIFSKRIWDYGLPSNISWGQYIETLVEEKSKLSATVWKFTYEDGICFGIGVHHPSYIKYNTQGTKDLLDLFFEKDYEILDIQ